MASQVPREHVLGNFKPTISERDKAKRTRKPPGARRPGMSEEHLALIRLLPSCISGRGPCEAHHLKSGPAKAERGQGQKATDRWAVPLTFHEHAELERLGSRHEEAWFRERGVNDVVELAAALWNGSGDLERMQKIEQAHMGRRRRGT
jgi:hypothetical protein